MTIKGNPAMKACKDCAHFKDGHYSRTYIVPICLAHGGDDASFMRQYICGIDDAKLYQDRASQPALSTRQPGSEVLDV